MKRRFRADAPVVITDAPRSFAQELAIRRRRYVWLMALRIPCLVGAALLYQTHWLAVAILALSIPLPWMAVLIANSRLPRVAAHPHRVPRNRREVEPAARAEEPPRRL